jgi:antitoxin component YwqK of YwqJK toxin-antitoxin module
MISRQYVLILCCSILSIGAFAQTDSAYYFDVHENRIDAKENAAYYKVIKSRNADGFAFTEYHKDGTRLEAFAKGGIERPVFLGTTTAYYKNGKVSIKKEYDNGTLVKTSGYYPNGVLIYVIIHRRAWPYNFIAYDADSSGRIHIENGNGRRQETDTIKIAHIGEVFTMEGPYKDGVKEGLWKGNDDRGLSFEERYEAGKLVSGTTVLDGKKYRYTKVYEYPSFNGSVDKFESRIMLSIKNPADTVGLQYIKPGYPHLSYVIDEHGQIADLYGFKNSRGPHVGIELKRPLPLISPARLRGYPVRYMIADNADYLVRNNFVMRPFNTDIYLKGQYIPPTR